MARVFYIRNPIDGKRQEIFYNKNQNKVNVLQNAILNQWEDYCDSYWICQGGNKNDIRLNHEDKIKGFLSTCATFLLLDSFEDSNSLTKGAIEKIKANELSLDGDWQNEEIETELEETVDYLNKYIKDKYKNDGKILTTRFDNDISPCRRNIKSKTSRQTKIYSTKDREVVNYKSIDISNTFNVWKKEIKTIKGRNGLIDKNKPYISEWCVVDTENIFTFKGKKYKISESVSQYKARKKKPRHDDYKNDYQMDKILVYEQDNKRYFFDQNIEQIKDNKILNL